MIKSNEQLILKWDDFIEIQKEVNLILISLHKMGSYYAVQKYKEYEYETETTRFIDECRITQRLAKIRAILTKKFDNTLGPDDMDDIERALENLKYWEKPGDKLEPFEEIVFDD